MSDRSGFVTRRPDMPQFVRLGALCIQDLLQQGAAKT
jgi:hypothetical protein